MNHDQPSSGSHAAVAPGAPELRPTAARDRLVQLDALRGVALLGILMVNMAFFLHPLGRIMDPSWLAEAGLDERAAWTLVDGLFTFKFISIFSLLFGFGVATQMERVARADESDLGFAVRRFSALAVLGAMHALLVWHGDVLFVYALLGVPMALMCRCRAQTVLIVAAVIASAIVVFTVGGSIIGLLAQASRDAMGAGAMQAADTATGDAAGAAQVAAAPLRGFDAMKAASFFPADPKWMQAETLAYREGPFVDALLFRSVTWAMFLVIAVFSYAWQVALMMLLGIWAFKVGFWSDAYAARRRKIGLLALAVGVPLTIIGLAAMWLGGFDAAWAFSVHQVTLQLSVLALPIGLAVWIGEVAVALPRLLVAPVAAAGRMALTVYLGESLMVTFLSYWWGLGWFGTVSGMQAIGLALLVWLALVVVATLWLRFFRMGPMEWLWRSATYMAWLPERATSR